MSEVQLASWGRNHIPQDERNQPQLCQHPHRCIAFIGCRLQILGFASSADLLVALLLTLLAGRTLFAQLERLMQQMEEGKLKAID